jgi:hypothetical protein
MLHIITISTAFGGSLDPSSMQDWNGETFSNTASMQQGYDIVIHQLGLAIANRPTPGSSSGIFGFTMSLNNSISFVDSKDYVDGKPSPWNLLTTTEENPPALWLPSINVSKGLPLSLELGVKGGLVASDIGSVFGTYIKCSPFEGYKKAPNIALQIGYSGYIGNPNLALGTMDMSVSIGKALPFGPIVGINESIIHPYAAVGSYWLRADPRFTESESERFGISPVSAFNKSDNFTEGYRNVAWDVGVEIQNNEILVAFSTSNAPNHLWSIQSNIGYRF